MVNYCCVYGCGRNSRLNKHLNYYGLPKERNRQVEWLKAAGREDLLQKDQEKVTGSHRFCSRHFPPNSIKNRNLQPDAVPTLCLPGHWSEGESDEDPLPHYDIYCDNCENPIAGFRYKCVTCKDFDLCQKCEMMEAHPEHFMLRMPKPIKFTVADNLTNKWRRFFNEEHVTPESLETSIILTDSSDDEPITKYSKNYDSGIDLSEDTKHKIKAEVTRVLKINHHDHKKSNKTVKKDKKRPAEEAEKTNKRPKLEDGDANNTDVTDLTSAAPEVAFADVNEMDHILDLKSEFPPSLIAAAAAEQTSSASEEQQPVMRVKLSDDLTELMIEVTSNHQKMVYKYAD